MINPTTKRLGATFSHRQSCHPTGFVFPRPLRKRNASKPLQLKAASRKPPPLPSPLQVRVRTVQEANKLDKQKLAALGAGAFSAYGVISNVNAGIIITIAWLTIVKTTGQMPTEAGNWPKFLAVYAGLWISSNFMRPIRLSLAIAAAPFFDKALNKISLYTGIHNKFGAFAIMLLFIAIGTISLLALTICLCGGFPGLTLW